MIYVPPKQYTELHINAILANDDSATQGILIAENNDTDQINLIGKDILNGLKRLARGQPLT